MAASYLQRGMGGEATFSLFIRQLPPTRGFLVAAGLEPCLDFLEGFGLSEEELDYLGRELGFEDPVLDALGALRFGGEVWAVPEGRVVYANEPLLEITAPIAVAQLVEPYLLNQITFQTTIASKAARCVVAAGGARRRGLLAPSDAGARRGARGRPLLGDRGVRGDEQRRGGQAVRPAAVGNDGAFVHRVVREREGGVPDLRPRLPRPHDLPRRHLRHAERRSDRDRGDRGARPLGQPRDPARQRRPRRAVAWRANAARRRRPAARSDLRERRARRGRARPSGPRRRADRRVRRRDPDGRLRRRAVARLGVQARRVRRTSDAQALRGQGDRARAQAGLPRPGRGRGGPARRAAARGPGAVARPGDGRRPQDRPAQNARDREDPVPSRSRARPRGGQADRGPGRADRRGTRTRSRTSRSGRRPTPSNARGSRSSPASSRHVRRRTRSRGPPRRRGSRGDGAWSSRTRSSRRVPARAARTRAGRRAAPRARSRTRDRDAA